MGTSPRPAAPRLARRRGDAPIEGKVQADAATRYAAALGAEADRIRVVKEVEVVRAQPVVAEDDVRVAVHVEFHEGRLLVEAASSSCAVGHRPSRLCEQFACRTAGGCPAAGARRHDIGSCAASSRLRKQCDTPECKRYLTQLV